jgi:hypothetical protein
MIVGCKKRRDDRARKRAFMMGEGRKGECDGIPVASYRESISSRRME